MTLSNPITPNHLHFYVLGSDFNCHSATRGPSAVAELLVLCLLPG